MSPTTSLLDVINDPRRREAEGKMGGESRRKQIVMLEGMGDLLFFKRHGRSSGLSYRYMGPKYAKRGKTGVINYVKGNNDTYGIVDMDHDFDSDEVEQFGRLNDTSRQCCLFSLALNAGGRDDLVMASIHIIQHLFNDGEVVARLCSSLYEKTSEFSDFIHEHTAATLFRGHLSTTMRIPLGQREEIAVTWSEIGDLSTSVSHLVPVQYADDFAEFKDRYELQLKSAGANDHALCAALILLFREVLAPEEAPSIPEELDVNKAITSTTILFGSAQVAAGLLSSLFFEEE